MAPKPETELMRDSRKSKHDNKLRDSNEFIILLIVVRLSAQIQWTLKSFKCVYILFRRRRALPKCIRNFAKSTKYEIYFIFYT